MQHWPWYLLIDESFISLDGVRGDLVERSHKIRSRILQWVGIPCGIGIGATKTLAKLANHIAKTAERKPGSYPESLAQVCNLAALPHDELASVMAATQVNEVWGVGRQISKQLVACGVLTVLDLVKLDVAMVRHRWGVVLERTVRELQGTPCIGLDAPTPKQQIACTRSFGHPVTELADLNEAVTEFASRAAQKLRKQGSTTSQVLVFIRTSPFRSDPQYSQSTTMPLRRPTADTAVIVQVALAGLKRIHRSGYKLAKAGVMLLDLQSDVYVITGPIYEPSIEKSLGIGPGQVRVPKYLFKLVYDENRNQAWAHWHLNDDTTHGSRPISYAELVKRTGITFLPGVRPID